MDEKRSALSVILKVILFILFGGIILLLIYVTDGTFDCFELFDGFFSRDKKNREQDDTIQ